MKALLPLLLLTTTALPQSITVTTLAREIGNLRSVAFANGMTFTARQFSSYDRRSVDPAAATDAGWFANGDQGQFLRVETRDGKPEYVMADADGPGAVMRIWSADPKGILRVYLDGADKPAIEEPFDKLLGGEHPLAKAPLAGVRSKGWNLHLPIPYAKHLKITLSEKQVYYHVDVRTYPAATHVESWSIAAQQAALGALEPAAARLLALAPPVPVEGTEPSLVEGVPDELPHPLDGLAAYPLQELTIPPLGTFMRSFSLQHFLTVPDAGPGGIVSAFTMRLRKAADRSQAWRNVVMRWTFDGEVCVETPLGDFFGSGPGMPAFASIAAGVTPDGLAWSRWAMPFSKSCELTLVNLGAEPVAIDLQVWLDQFPMGSHPRHFHANWRQQLDFSTKPRQDWNALSVEGGPGVYVGCAFSIANPVPEWWGEGDEKMYVDGEKFPSTFGTGSEDFFGYAWSNPALFQHALHGQPRCDGPGTKGFTALYRWQLADCVPWTKSFRFDLEVWHWKECTISQAMTVYWYADPGVHANFPPLTQKSLAIPVLRVPEVK